MVNDAEVLDWIRRLPGPRTALVLLLGYKPDGMSEYWFYSFRSQSDGDVTKPSFHKWMEEQGVRSVASLAEFRTTDFARPPEDLLGQVRSALLEFSLSSKIPLSSILGVNNG